MPEQVEERVAGAQRREPPPHALELRRGERAEQPAVDQHEPGEVAVAGAAAEVPRRVGDRHRGAERVPAEDHLAAPAPRAPHDAPQVLEREPQAPLAHERHRVAGDGGEPSAAQVVVERLIRIARGEALVILERLRAPVVGPHLQPLHALDDLRPDEREVARAALRAGDEDQDALRRAGAEALVAHAVVARGAGPGGAGDGDDGPRRQRRRAAAPGRAPRGGRIASAAGYVPRPGIATPDS